MAASYASDVGGGSHHDALLSLRDLPSFQDKYTVEYVATRVPLGLFAGQDTSKGRCFSSPPRASTLTPLLSTPGTCGSAGTAVTYGARPRPLKARFAGWKTYRAGTLTAVPLGKPPARTRRLFWFHELFSATRFEPPRVTDKKASPRQPSP